MAARHLIFVRHGESEHHVNGLTGGWTDTPLTALGRQQVDATARYLASRRMSNLAMYCSDLKRASESAAIIGSRVGLDPVSRPDLRELNNGDAAGMTLEEASKISLPGLASRDLDWQPYANAESWRVLFERMKSALAAIEAEVDGGQTILIVGHGLSGQALVLAWLQLDPALNVALHFDTASVTELIVNEWGEREITRLNTTFFDPLVRL